jgi:hypothetical protein
MSRICPTDSIFNSKPRPRGFDLAGQAASLVKAWPAQCHIFRRGIEAAENKFFAG